MPCCGSRDKKKVVELRKNKQPVSDFLLFFIYFYLVVNLTHVFVFPCIVDILLSGLFVPVDDSVVVVSVFSDCVDPHRDRTNRRRPPSSSNVTLKN